MIHLHVEKESERDRMAMGETIEMEEMLGI